MLKPTKTQKQLADRLFTIGAIQFGAFTVKHHSINPNAPLSPLYINFRLLRSDYEAMRLAIDELKTVTGHLLFDCLADIPSCVTPLVGIWSFESKKPMVSPREPKPHGLRNTVDGIYSPGQKVLLVDDLITQGTSKFRSIELLEEAGLTVNNVCVILDREEGGAEKLREKGYNLSTVMHLSDLLAYYRETNRITQKQYKNVITYLKESHV